jgi:uncharacterized membrane protein YfcA
VSPEGIMGLFGAFLMARVQGMADLPAFWTYVLLIPLGLVIATYGTLIGAGGGILIVPALLLLYPHESANVIASISLAVIFLNAVSGTLAYGHMHRIDYHAGLLFAAFAVPAGFLGAYVTSVLSRRVFDLAFSVLILSLATFIFLRPTPKHQNYRARSRDTIHRLTDFKGNSFVYSFSSRRGVLLSFGIGLVSSMLGMGGGPFYVTMLVYALHFPLHVATATTQFMLMIIGLSWSAAHIIASGFEHGISRTLFLGIGVLIGAQIGAQLSQRMAGSVIGRVMACGLLLIGIRLAIHAFEF